MASIDRRGFVDDGSSDLAVAGSVTVDGNIVAAGQLAGSLSFDSISELASYPTSQVSAGQPAYVSTVGALWSYQPSGSLSIDDIRVVTGSNGGQWWRGPSLISLSALEQPTWFIDPSNSTENASDENTGLSSEVPLLSYAEVVRRWGTASPKIDSNSTITWLSSGPVTDPLLCTPVSGSVNLVGAQSASGSLMTISSFVDKNKVAGTLATITVDGFGSWTPGILLHDTTANATFWIVADLGGGTASISQPMSMPVTILSTPVLLSSGDKVSIITQPSVYLAAIGGIETTGFVFANSLNLQLGVGPCRVNNAGISECNFIGLGGNVQSRINEISLYPYCIGCFFTKMPSGSGVIAGKFLILAGALDGAGNNFSHGTIIDQDAVLMLRCHNNGILTLGSVYIQQLFEYEGFIATQIVLYSIIQGPVTIYGPMSLAINRGLQVIIEQNVGRQTTASGSLLFTGGMSMDGQGTAFSFNPNTGNYVGPLPITPANIDASGSLSNPTTGSRIFIG